MPRSKGNPLGGRTGCPRRRGLPPERGRERPRGVGGDAPGPRRRRDDADGGGAGSLLPPDGTRLIDSPDFPEAYRPEAAAGAAFLDALQGETDLDWTFLSPSATIAPGERTDRFRLGDDALLVGEDGPSRISQADYAIRFMDELERPAHSRQRCTVGY